MSPKPDFHENLNRSEPEHGSSDRSFGLVFAAVFTLIGGVRLYHGSPLALLWLAAAAVVLAVALVRPTWLAPFNHLWFRFGLLLHRIVNPIVMGLLFFLCVVPIGLLIRALGKDPLRLRRDAGAASYWIFRDPPGPAPATLKDQF